MFLCEPPIHTPIHPCPYLFTTYLSTYQLLLISYLLHTYLALIYLSTYTPNYLSFTNVIKKLVIITNVNDDDKMLKININLIINKHFKIIGVNDNLKN
jgi:hypothetical protein